MARYNNGINGPVKGKIGNVVAVSWRGIEVLRGLPEFSGKKPTPGQFRQRQLMSLVSSFLQPMKPWIEIGFQHFVSGRTAMNAAVSFVMKNAVLRVDNDLKIDYSQVIFSRGELMPSIPGTLRRRAKVLPLSWDNFSASALNNNDDRLSVIVYCSEMSKFIYFKDCAQRVDLKASLRLPEEFAGYAVHCWLQYVNVAGDIVSTSVYIKSTN